MSAVIPINGDVTPPENIATVINAAPSELANDLQAISNFQKMLNSKLVRDQDYGVIPGTSKPTLLKPGAEKIQMLMGLSSQFEVIDQTTDLQRGYFDYTVKASLFKNGKQITEGLGNANTLEKKFAKGDGFSQKNTVLKMAKKRAQIDAILTVSSLSNIFTQDLEDTATATFERHERVETMTFEEAFNVKMPFGKYKGMSLGQIMNEDRNYLNFVVKKADKPEIKQGARILMKGRPNGNNAGATQEQLRTISGQIRQLAVYSHGTPNQTATDVIVPVIPKWTGTKQEWRSMSFVQADKILSQLASLMAAYQKR